MKTTFFFYDLETSGLNPREDRIMQFAGQRTDMDLNPIGDPVDIHVKLPDDTLPSPGAIMVTKITPQKTFADGLTEAEFSAYVTNEIFVPNTIAVGYNTVRFDDEFMRHTFWRNFYDPYEFEWKDGRSRWDFLDVVRLTRALRPEGITWPFRDDGVPTNRLELITKLNHIEHEHAHDALADVYATIAVAKLIKEKQPDLFDYLLKMRDKKEIKKLINLDTKRPFVYSSGRYANEFNKTAVAIPLAPSRNGNILVFDLRYNLDKLLNEAGGDVCSSSEVSATNGERIKRSSPRNDGSERASSEKNDVDRPRRHSFYPIVKELCYNKCPVVAPLGVLEKSDGWQKLNLDKFIIDQNLKSLLAHPEFAEQMREKAEQTPEFPPAIDPESALYDGFLSDRDRIYCNAVRNADEAHLADFTPAFSDERLPELLIHYKARNFPKSLSESEAEKWQAYRKARLARQAKTFLPELEKNADRDPFVAEELKLYFESLFDSDY